MMKMGISDKNIPNWINPKLLHSHKLLMSMSWKTICGRRTRVQHASKLKMRPNKSNSLKPRNSRSTPKDQNVFRTIQAMQSTTSDIVLSDQQLLLNYKEIKNIVIINLPLTRTISVSARSRFRNTEQHNFKERL